MAESTLFGVKDAGDKVKSVADAVQKVRKKLSQWQVADTVKMDDLNPKKHPIQSVEDFVAGARKWAEWNSEVAQTIAKPTGVVALWIMEYITRGIDKVLVDNPVLRAMEDKFTRVKVPEKSQEGSCCDCEPVSWLQDHRSIQLLCCPYGSSKAGHLLFPGGQLHHPRGL